MGALPLEGVRVVDLSWAVAGPITARVLADFGADVVRIESSDRLDVSRCMPPFVDGVPDTEMAALFINCNAGKMSMGIDLSAEAGRNVVRDLAAWADVVVESYAPGVIEKWGLTYSSLGHQNPRLIMLSTSLMGHTGPLANMAGYGNVGSALSGLKDLTGWPGRTPFGPFGPYTDAIAPRFALFLILAALDHRRETGRGCYIDLSQVECALGFLTPQLADYFQSGRVVTRSGNRDDDMVPHGVFRCADRGDDEAAWIAIAVQNDAQWARLQELMGAPAALAPHDLSSLEGRLMARDAIERWVEEWVRPQVVEELERLLQGEGIPAYEAVSLARATEDAQFEAWGHFVGIPHPIVSETVIEGPRYQLSDTPPGRPAASPLLGEHTEYVAREILGYRPSKIQHLLREGVLQRGDSVPPSPGSGPLDVPGAGR